MEQLRLSHGRMSLICLFLIEVALSGIACRVSREFQQRGSLEVDLCTDMELNAGSILNSEYYTRAEVMQYLENQFKDIGFLLELCGLEATTLLREPLSIGPAGEDTGLTRDQEPFEVRFSFHAPGPLLGEQKILFIRCNKRYHFFAFKDQTSEGVEGSINYEGRKCWHLPPEKVETGEVQPLSLLFLSYISSLAWDGESEFAEPDDLFMSIEKCVVHPDGKISFHTLRGNESEKALRYLYAVVPDSDHFWKLLIRYGLISEFSKDKAECSENLVSLENEMRALLVKQKKNIQDISHDELGEGHDIRIIWLSIKALLAEMEK